MPLQRISDEHPQRLVPDHGHPHLVDQSPQHLLPKQQSVPPVFFGRVWATRGRKYNRQTGRPSGRHKWAALGKSAIEAKVSQMFEIGEPKIIVRHLI